MKAGLALLALASAAEGQALPEFDSRGWCGSDHIEPAAFEDCLCMERESRADLEARRDEIDPARLAGCLAAADRLDRESYYLLSQCATGLPPTAILACFQD